MSNAESLKYPSNQLAGLFTIAVGLIGEPSAGPLDKRGKGLLIHRSDQDNTQRNPNVDQYTAGDEIDAKQPPGDD
ncbi:MAG: hypothetical protein C0630_02325 [Sedimenticola selenatireducens]|uniref:Uncharacterized protein n=1 Tax=Sedimenticola selenatireducens TaxID=191960 RepID=A0A2N6D030_9GAMM|nr:MAG: hypothetical protein C0630_02325 [Sedimenticola selenatireducens]